MLDPSLPVATLVLDHSSCAPVFVRHRIDYCCKGQRSLSDACRELGLDEPAVISELETAIARRNRAAVDPRSLSTRDVIVKVIAPHHQYLHRSMPFLQTLAAKVARVHGERQESLREVDRLVTQLVTTLHAHLLEEENVLFPALIADQVGEVTPMLREMKRDHEAVGEMLAALRTAAQDFVAPEWACNSYRTLMTELAFLEADTLEHVHVENHVLLPRFIPTA
jgi:regulator of cell morphogenesis and NO signaling